MDEVLALLNTSIPIWFLVVWLFVLNPAIEALPEPTPTSSPFYGWFYKFANTASGNFQEAMRHKIPNGNGKDKPNVG